MRTQRLGYVYTNPTGSLTLPQEIHQMEGAVVVTVDAEQQCLDLTGAHGACVLCGDVAFTHFWGKGVCKTCQRAIRKIEL